MVVVAVTVSRTVVAATGVLDGAGAGIDGSEVVPAAACAGADGTVAPSGPPDVSAALP